MWWQRVCQFIEAPLNQLTPDSMLQTKNIFPNIFRARRMHWFGFVWCTVPRSIIPYRGATPAQQGEGIALSRRCHQIHPHCLPVSPTSLFCLLTNHLLFLQLHDQEALLEMVHGFKPTTWQLVKIKSWFLEVWVKENALKSETGVVLCSISHWEMVVLIKVLIYY